MVANKTPSIFNDVIGPVMRGPSSSHCAASLRIGRIALELMDGSIDEVLVEFDPKGSLATTHESQGSDMGLCGGFLGWDPTDPRLSNSINTAAKQGLNIDYALRSLSSNHPNTYQINLRNRDESRRLTALSTGGGMIEIISIDDYPVSIMGDCFDLLVFIKKNGEQLAESFEKASENFEVNFIQGSKKDLVEIKSTSRLKHSDIDPILKSYSGISFKRISPVLPVLSGKDTSVPFITCEGMLSYNSDKNLSLQELALSYESSRGSISENEVFRQMQSIVLILKQSLRAGLEGTDYHDRILGCQSNRFKKRMEAGYLLDTGLLNPIIMCVSAMMEVKSSWGVIVAAPTAGACGTLPGSCLGAALVLDSTEEELTNAFLAAGMIGIFISAQSTFAAEVGGCQAECGAAAGMAAAALVTLAKGSLKETLAAASMALQNSFGLVCDPLANRVEVPCLGKNVSAAANALSCANMALAGYDPVIPLDEVIEAMDRVGKSLPCELRCTALGGLSTTPTSHQILRQLREDD